MKRGKWNFSTPTEMWLTTPAKFIPGGRCVYPNPRRLLTCRNLNGSLDEVATRVDDNFGFAVPLNIEGLDSNLLNPRQCWADAAAYDEAAKNLAQRLASAVAKLAPQTEAMLIAAE